MAELRTVDPVRRRRQPAPVPAPAGGRPPPVERGVKLADSPDYGRMRVLRASSLSRRVADEILEYARDNSRPGAAR